MLLFQRVALAAQRLAGSRAKMSKAMAEVLGIHQRTFDGYFCEERENNLWPVLPAIMKAYPMLSREWLYFGEGPMLKSDSYPEKLTAVNSKGMLIGDMLNVVLDFAKITNDEIQNKTNIDKVTLNALLESRIKPTFEHLEELYSNFGINPSYFFDRNEHQMWVPSDPLLRVYFVLGKLGHEPHRDDLIDIFDISKEDAREFLEEWNSFRDEGLQRVLPASWEKCLVEKYNLNLSWVFEGIPPVVLVDREFQAARRTSDDTQHAENIRLQQELLDVERRLLALHVRVMTTVALACKVAGLDADQTLILRASVVDFEECQTEEQVRDAAARYAPRHTDSELMTGS